jgi:CheY-like chemotaxis protein
MSSVLYIEDEPDDVYLMERTFRKMAPDIDLKVISDGRKAVEFFEETANSVLDLGLVLLDLNLPGLSGLKVLSQIRKSPHISHVPVVVFSASNQPSDISASYAGGCNAYLVKPGDPDRLKSIVGLLKDFWLVENRRAY